MEVSPNTLECVVYIMADQEHEGVVEPRAIGTGFYVLADSPSDPSKGVPHIVTARHVIENINNDTIIVRVNSTYKGEIGFEDVATNKNHWFIHDDADVAAINIKLPPTSKEIDRYAIHCVLFEQFVRDDMTCIGPAGQKLFVNVGAEAFFVGLFVQSPGEERNFPIARFGRISRLVGQKVSLWRQPEVERFKTDAFLVETFSWGGHSGSPAFWSCPYHVFIKHEEMGQYIQTPRDYTGFLGLITAHFEIGKAAKAEGDILGSIYTSLNAGIAVITPAWKIKELLMRGDVVEARREQTKEG